MHISIWLKPNTQTPITAPNSPTQNVRQWMYLNKEKQGYAWKDIISFRLETSERWQSKQNEKVGALFDCWNRYLLIIHLMSNSQSPHTRSPWNVPINLAVHLFLTLLYFVLNNTKYMVYVGGGRYTCPRRVWTIHISFIFSKPYFVA
jgi:hypothetical protein